MSANARRIVQRTVDTNALLAARAERDALAADVKRLRDALGEIADLSTRRAVETRANGRPYDGTDWKNLSTYARAALAETARKGG